MSVFLNVLGGMGLFALFVVALGGPLILWLGGPDMDWRIPLKVKLAATVGGILLMPVVITIFIGWCGAFGVASDSSHCGPGTRYVSESHLVGKTIITDWACVTP